jgi:hypothetical protein
MGVGVVQGTTRNPGLTVFLHAPSVAKDPNTIMTELFELVRSSWTPAHKYMLCNFDNTPAENKHRWMLAEIASFVWFDWFESADAILMPPGHTHGYPDAIFAHLKRALGKHTLPSLAAAVQALETAFRKPTATLKVAILQQALNFKKLFDRVLHADLKGHASPLNFHFFRDASLPGRPVRMLVRATSQEKWKGDGALPCHPPITVIQDVPFGLPEPVPLRQLSDEDAGAIKATLAKAVPVITAAEAESLSRIIDDSSLGAHAVTDDDGAGVGVRAELQRPTEPGQQAQSVSVRLITGRPPDSLAPPPSARPEPPAAPSVPLLIKPRQAFVTTASGSLKKLKAQAADEADADSGAAAVAMPAPSSGDASSSGSPARSTPKRRSSHKPKAKSKRASSAAMAASSASEPSVHAGSGAGAVMMPAATVASESASSSAAASSSTSAPVSSSPKRRSSSRKHKGKTSRFKDSATEDNEEY